MQAVTDPGEVSSENLAASLSGEIERLRFAIKEMKGAVQWYTTTATKVHTPMGPLFAAEGTNPHVMGDGVASVRNWQMVLPQDYIATNTITVSFHFQPTATGIMTLTFDVRRSRDATAVTDIQLAVDFSQNYADTNTHVLNYGVPGAGFVAGDSIFYDLTRAGNTDANAGNLIIRGSSVSYTGYASR